MADDSIMTQEVQGAPEPQAADAKAQLDQLMAANLNAWLPKEQQIVVPEPAQEQAVVQEGSTGNVSEVQATEPAATTVPEFKFNEIVTEFGYEKPEDVVAALREYKTFRDAPPTPAELKFENEKSKLLFEAIKSGKTADVYTLLDEQQRLERLTSLEVTKDTAADIIKAGFQLKYKGLSPEMVEHKFNKTFGIPAEPRISEDEDAEDFTIRHNEWKAQVKDVEMERLIEANLIKPELESAKAKLVLPEIPQTQDQEYLQWKQEQENLVVENAKVIEAYKAFKHEDVKYDQDFIDEANKINVKLEYVPSAEDFRKAQECVVDLDKFFSMYKNSDGSPNRKAFMQDIALLINKKAYTASIANQVKNATIKASLPDNQSERSQKQVVNVGEESELDRLMRLNGITRG